MEHRYYHFTIANNFVTTLVTALMVVTPILGVKVDNYGSILVDVLMRIVEVGGFIKVNIMGVAIGV